MPQSMANTNKMNVVSRECDVERIDIKMPQFSPENDQNDLRLMNGLRQHIPNI